MTIINGIHSFKVTLKFNVRTNRYVGFRNNSFLCYKRLFGRNIMADRRSELITCHGCLEEYTMNRVPRLLPCTHTLCQACLERLIEMIPGNLKCPLCRRRHNMTDGVATFPVNLEALEILIRRNQEQQKKTSSIVYMYII